MNELHRRDLLALGVAASAPLILPGLLRASIRQPEKNSSIGIGFIGTGKRALEMLGPVLKRSDARVLAVCDVDSTRRENAKAIVDKHYGSTDCFATNDYAALLARPGIDAVVISTPDHWHANQCLHAMAAGKDIYCEKPLTLTLDEGPLLIAAARTHNTVFQTGSQQRTEFGHGFVKACELIRAGRVGDLLTVHVGVGTTSVPCDLNEEPLEPGLDWDRWLGPAPLRPYHSVLSPRGIHNHYPNWRLYSEYSGGMMTDFGAHHFDIVQWALDADTSGPVRIIPPDEKNAQYGCTLIYPSGLRVIHGGPSGITFIGTKGMLRADRGTVTSSPDTIVKEPLSGNDTKLPRHTSHMDNWFDCLRSRSRPICDVEVGARSVAVPLLCNLAYRHRRELKWDPQTWSFVGDAEANTWRGYERRKGFELPSA